MEVLRAEEWQASEGRKVVGGGDAQKVLGGGTPARFGGRGDPVERCD